MLTAAQQHAADQFAEGLLALSADALIDTYHQAADDLRAARGEGSDNLSKATRRHLQPKRRCEIGSLIIEPAIRRGTPEQTRRITVQERARGDGQRPPGTRGGR
jgi:hypothetical protein